eukprot:5515699-Prymnesium_polylepis.1
MRCPPSLPLTPDPPPSRAAVSACVPRNFQPFADRVGIARVELARHVGRRAARALGGARHHRVAHVPRLAQQQARADVLRAARRSHHAQPLAAHDRHALELGGADGRACARRWPRAQLDAAAAAAAGQPHRRGHAAAHR